MGEKCLYELIADSSAGWECLEDPDGRMLWVSPSCEPITGHSPDEFLNDPDLLLAIVHPEDRAHFESHRRECLRSDDRDETTFRIVRPDGGVRWIGHQCQPLRLPGGTSVGRRTSNKEITKRKEGEEELLRRNRTLRALTRTNQALIRAKVESDLLDDICRIVVGDCGHAMAWIGFAEENEGKSVRPVAQAGFENGYLDTLRITWADTERGRGPTGTAIRTGRPSTCLNMQTDPRFAPWREEALKRGYASSIVLPLLDEGKAFGAINIYSREPGPFPEEETALLSELAADLSRGIAAIRGRAEREKAETQLRELNETLESRVAERTAEAERQAAQLKALASELSQTERRERLWLASALHDHLQQVLVAAKLNLDALQARVSDEALRSDVLKVAQLLDASLAWCRSVTATLSPPVLQEVGLAGGLGWLARQMQEQQSLQVNLSECDEWVEPADADLKAFLFEAVRELLINVVKHADVPAARVEMRREDGTFEIRVEDEGKGFDPGRLREQEKEEAHFGLFSIQQRLEMMGGSMSVESAVGHGTRVTLRALCGPAPARAGAVAEPPAGVIPEEGPGRVVARSGRVRVVIADDHRIFRQGFRALLAVEEAIDVVGEAADGAEAVELARTLRPDVVVMDVSMPKMNGVEATRKIVAELPGVQVIGLSMHEDEEIARSMREAGAVGFVTKGGPSDAAISAIYAAHLGGKKP